MRVKLIVILITLILLTSYISVEASSDDFILEKGSYCKSPFVDNFRLFLPSDEVIKEMLNTAPLAFTENYGQLENDDVRFYVQGGGLWFMDDGVWFELREEITIESRESDDWFDPMNIMEPQEPVKYKCMILKQEFVGANPMRPEGKEPLGYYSNFFYGNDSSKWCTQVPNYREVYFENLYDGIDLKYYSNDNGLKYDIIVHPDADVSQIRIRYEGADGLEIDAYGNLIIETPIEDIVDGELFIYQNHDNIRQGINGSFIKYDDLEYGFEITEKYDDQKVLVIDPNIKLEYSTYIGGINNDYGNKITVDDTGNAYVTGYTYSNNFPTKVGSYDTNFNGGLYDTFVLKLNPDGSSLNYSTFIGGSNNERSLDIAVDSQGNTYLTGDTSSNNFPTVNAYDSTFNSASDVFVLKLNPAGSTLLFSTYIGTANTDYGKGIAVDLIGSVFITGYTWFTTLNKFPTTTGAYDRIGKGSTDVFVLKLNNTGTSLDYSTFIAGTLGENGYDITIDSNGNAYVTGRTGSSDFPKSFSAYDPSHNGGNDVFVLKLNHNGSALQYSTFLGGSNDERGYGIALDSNRNAIVTGYTESSSFPNTTGAFDQSHNGNKDVFISKLNQTGASLKFSTFVGGNGDDEGHDLTIDSSGNILVTGDTASSTFPTSNDAYDNAYNSSEAYFLKLSSDGSTLIYSSYLGGTSSDYARGIDLDIMQNLYVTGYTDSSDFPTTTGAYNETFNGGYDVFVVKFATTPFINITSLSLLENNQPTSDIYSRYRPYTFRVKILDTVGVSDLAAVRLTLDPLGSNIRLKWDRLTGVFSELSDPNNYVSIHPSSKAYSNLIWTIDFNVTFNWNYPDENLNDVQVYATSATLSPAWLNTTNMYEVENDLVFNGTLLVKGDNNRTIYEDSLVRGGEQLNWTGLTPVYENTTDVYPPEDEFNVTIWDDEVSSWTDSPASGEPFYVETNTTNMTYNTSFTYTITLTEVPPACAIIDETFTIMLSRIPPESDKTNETFEVFIDADNVTFLNATPLNTTWQMKKDVVVGIEIEDIGGGVVNGNSVMYSISIDDGQYWSDWKFISGLNSELNILVSKLVSLKEGKNNLIKWKAMDSLGNGPAQSEPFRILVDTENVKFSNARPLITDISSTEEVELSITISDTISGVDSSSIEYSVSEDRGKTWGNWQTIKGYQNGLKINVEINHTFPNGTNNMLMWRASDIAGNGPTESQPLIINVNTWVPIKKPKVTLLLPPYGITINDTNVKLKWELEDSNFKNVTFDIYFDNDSPPGIKEIGVINTTYFLDNLEDGETYYWRVIPKLGELEGSSNSGVWWFYVGISKPEPVLDVEITGRKEISLYPGENKSEELTITNLGTVDDVIKIEIETGKLSKYVTLNDYSMLKLSSQSDGRRLVNIRLPITVQPGIYEVIINAISMNSGQKEKDSHILTIEIKEPEVPKPNGNETNITDDKPQKKSDNILMLILVPIIISIILFIALIAVLKKRKKLTEQELLAPGTFAIKPGTLPAPVIALDQVPGAPSVAQLPGTTVNGSQQLTVVVPQLTKSTQITQPTISQPITQSVVSPALPQLPPAQTQATSTETIETAQPSVVTSSPTLTPTIAPSTQVPKPTIDTTQIPLITNASPTPATTQTTQGPTLTTTSIPTIAQPEPQGSSTPKITPTPSIPSGPEIHLPDSTPRPSVVSSSQPESSVTETTQPISTTQQPQPSQQPINKETPGDMVTQPTPISPGQQQVVPKKPDTDEK